MAESAPTDAPATTSKHADARNSEAPRGEANVSAAVVTINRPAQEIYDFWRDLTNLPQVMENVERIDVIGSDRSHWVVTAPGGRTVEWDSVITADEPGKLLAWESTGEGSIRNSGTIAFTDAGLRGTVVRATLAYDPPGGAVGAIVAKLFQREPAIQARRDLRRLKQFLETGEVATSSSTLAHNAQHKAG